jgi:hypothetical protein
MTGGFITTQIDWRFDFSDIGRTNDSIGLLWLEDSFMPHVIKRRCGTLSMCN